MLFRTEIYRLDVKEKDTSLNTKVCNKEEEKVDVWQDVEDALNKVVIMLHQRILQKQSKSR